MQSRFLHIHLMIRIYNTDERADGSDDSPTSDVLDAALTHLIQSEQNLRDARDDFDPATIQRFNTEVVALQYRSRIDSRWW
ncbi:DUF7386 family protein [Haloplanus halobius]|uniref:DUF7386 family protein n=1 Tax=Haloplanus halobius TaxID=2934938 RepID=UPI003CE50B58